MAWGTVAWEISGIVFCIFGLGKAQNLVHYLSKPWYLRPRVVLPQLEIQQEVDNAPPFWRTPIFLICRDRLYYLQMLVSQLQSLGYYHIIAIDNNSTYKPLLSWYKEKLFWVLHLPANLGNEISKVLWRMHWNRSTHMTEYIRHFGGRYVLADPDTLFEANVPRNWLQHFWEIMDRHNVNKVGAALRLDDLPNHYAARKQVWQHECRFWREDLLVQKEKHVFWAPIDTTMALIRVFQREMPASNPSCCLRVAGPYTVRHLPWYENSRWLLPDVSYAKKNRGQGHTFGWWSRAEGFARRGKTIIDSDSPTGQFGRASNETFVFPAGVEYVGFCRRFSHGIPATTVRPPQCQQAHISTQESRSIQVAGVQVRFALGAFQADLWPSFEGEAPAFFAALRRVVKDLVVLDAGAGIGFSTLWLAQLGARVVALEPAPNLFKALCQNLAANEDVQAC